jgi:ATP-dependent DNA ligase
MNSEKIEKTKEEVEDMYCEREKVHTFSIRTMRWVKKPAILLRSRFEEITATSWHTRLFTWKSVVNLG